MSALKKVAIGAGATLVAVVLVSFVLPANAHVERSITVDRPTCNVHAMLDHYRLFNQWSPWAARDPDTAYTFEGPDSGVGAKLSWVSEDPDVGTGSQEIVGSTPCERVETRLEFAGQGGADAWFAIEPEGGGTKLTWHFDSELGMNPLMRYMGLMFDSLIGADYEQGLAAFKAMAEAMPAADLAGVDASVEDVAAIPIAYVEETTPKDAGAVGAAMGEAFGAIGAYVAASGLQVAGAPLSVNVSETDATYTFHAAFPLAAAPAEPPTEGEVAVGETPSGRTLKIVHVGPYDKLGETYARAAAWAAARGYETGAPSWEQYVSDPGDTAPDQLITNVYFPLKQR